MVAMANFIIIFVCLVAGLTFRKFRAFPPNSAQVLNAFVIYISLPAVILAQIPPLLSNITLSSDILIPVSLAWFNFALSFAVFFSLGKLFKWSPPKTGALILTAGLGNTAFVGFPLLEALVGPQAIPLGLLIDQPGSFLVLSTLGITVAALFSGSRVSGKFVIQRVLTFPPFTVLLFAILWSLVGTHGHSTLSPVFERLGGTLVPIALFAVGFQLDLNPRVLRKRALPLTYGLSFKLILSPLLFAFLYMKLWRGDDLTTQVTVLEAAMAPMITSAVVATEFKLDSELANLMVGVGIPLSLLTVPLFNYLLF